MNADALPVQPQPEVATATDALPGFQAFVPKIRPKGKGEKYTPEELAHLNQARELAAQERRKNPAQWGTFSIWRRAIRDGRISKEAYWLWNFLRDVAVYGTAKRPHASLKNIAEHGRCKMDSILGWIDELKVAGWLEVITSTHGNEYRICNGFGAWVRNFGDKRQLDLGFEAYQEGRSIKINFGTPFKGDTEQSGTPLTGDTGTPIKWDAETSGTPIKGGTHTVNVQGCKDPECKEGKPPRPLKHVEDWKLEKDLKAAEERRRTEKRDPDLASHYRNQVEAIKHELRERGKEAAGSQPPDERQPIKQAPDLPKKFTGKVPTPDDWKLVKQWSGREEECPEQLQKAKEEGARLLAQLQRPE